MAAAVFDMPGRRRLVEACGRGQSPNANDGGAERKQPVRTRPDEWCAKTIRRGVSPDGQITQETPLPFPVLEQESDLHGTDGARGGGRPGAGGSPGGCALRIWVPRRVRS